MRREPLGMTTRTWSIQALQAQPTLAKGRRKPTPPAVPMVLSALVIAVLTALSALATAAIAAMAAAEVQVAPPIIDCCHVVLLNLRG